MHAGHPLRATGGKAMMSRGLFSVGMVLCFAAACATASKDVASSYVSPLQYQDYDCKQIAAELSRVSSRVSQVGGRLDQAASNDQGIAAAGVLLFWPALFFLGGTKEQEAEYGRLKGQMDALQSVAIQKKCAT
jgi:hypothetical protein